MKKVCLFIILLSLFASGSYAQKRKKEAKEIKAPEEELYVYDYQVNEVIVGYGFAPAMQWIGSFDNLLSNDATYGKANTWGAVNLSYLYRPNDYATFGLSYSFTGLQREIVVNNRLEGNLISNIHVIMPVFKSNWYKKKYVTLYSKVALGVAVGVLDLNVEGVTTRSTSAEFAFQVSPIGIEIGKQFAFFAEAGFGYQGALILGFRYRF